MKLILIRKYMSFSIFTIFLCILIFGIIEGILFYVHAANVNHNYNSNLSNQEYVIKEFPICTAHGDQYLPAIYEGMIVWTDERNGNDDIYGFDLATGQEFPICINPSTQRFPAIYKNIVVWEDWRNLDNNINTDIYYYDLISKQEFQITTDKSQSLYPKIYGNIVIWHSGKDKGVNIYGYNLSTKQEFRITKGDYRQEFGDIYKNIIVYENGNDSNIHIYNLSTGQDFQLSHSSSHASGPSIYDKIVVWQDWRDGNYDPSNKIYYNPNIYGYNLSTGQEFRITTNTDFQTDPDVYGNIIVWKDYRDGRNNIYGYDISTGSEFLVTHNNSSGVYPHDPVIYGNLVVWADARNGNGNIYGAHIDFSNETTSSSKTETQLPSILFLKSYQNLILYSCIALLCLFIGIIIYKKRLPPSEEKKPIIDTELLGISCLKCGVNNAKNSKFCRNCGNELGVQSKLTQEEMRRKLDEDYIEGKITREEYLLKRKELEKLQ